MGEHYFSHLDETIYRWYFFIVDEVLIEIDCSFVFRFYEPFGCRIA